MPEIKRAPIKFGSVFHDLHTNSAESHRVLLEKRGLELNPENIARFYARERPKTFAYYVRSLIEKNEEQALLNLILHFRSGDKVDKAITVSIFKQIAEKDKKMARKLIEDINDVNSKRYLPKEGETSRSELPKPKAPEGPPKRPTPERRAPERVEEPRPREIRPEELLKPQKGDVEVEVDPDTGEVRRKEPINMVEPRIERGEPRKTQPGTIDEAERMLKEIGKRREAREEEQRRRAGEKPVQVEPEKEESSLWDRTKKKVDDWRKKKGVEPQRAKGPIDMDKIRRPEEDKRRGPREFRGKMDDLEKNVRELSEMIGFLGELAVKDKQFSTRGNRKFVESLRKELVKAEIEDVADLGGRINAALENVYYMKINDLEDYLNVNYGDKAENMKEKIEARIKESGGVVRSTYGRTKEVVRVVGLLNSRLDSLRERRVGLIYEMMDALEQNGAEGLFDSDNEKVGYFKDIRKKLARDRFFRYSNGDIRELYDSLKRSVNADYNWLREEIDKKIARLEKLDDNVAKEYRNNFAEILFPKKKEKAHITVKRLTNLHYKLISALDNARLRRLEKPSEAQILEVEGEHNDVTPPIPGEETLQLPDVSDKEIDRQLEGVNLSGHPGRVEQKMSAEELHLREHIKSYPDSGNAHYDFGIFLYDHNRFSEAEQVCRKAVELSPKDPLMHNLLGVVLRNLGRLPEAEKSFRKALELDPNWDFVQKNLDDVVKRQKPEAPVEQKKEAKGEEADDWGDGSGLDLDSGFLKNGKVKPEPKPEEKKEESKVEAPKEVRTEEGSQRAHFFEKLALFERYVKVEDVKKAQKKAYLIDDTDFKPLIEMLDSKQESVSKAMAKELTDYLEKYYPKKKQEMFDNIMKGVKSKVPGLEQLKELDRRLSSLRMHSGSLKERRVERIRDCITALSSVYVSISPELRSELLKVKKKLDARFFGYNDKQLTEVYDRLKHEVMTRETDLRKYIDENIEVVPRNKDWYAKAKKLQTFSQRLSELAVIANEISYALEQTKQEPKKKADVEEPKKPVETAKALPQLLPAREVVQEAMLVRPPETVLKAGTSDTPRTEAVEFLRKELKAGQGHKPLPAPEPEVVNGPIDERTDDLPIVDAEETAVFNARNAQETRAAAVGAEGRVPPLPGEHTQQLPELSDEELERVFPDLKKTAEEKKVEPPKPPIDPNNPYGIPEADLKRIRAQIKDSELRRTDINKRLKLSGQIGDEAPASLSAWVEGVRESKYLNPQQKEKVLRKGIEDNFVLLNEDIEALKKRSTNLPQVYGFSRTYRTLDDMITNVPELLEPYKARVNSVFAELEKLRVERKVEIPDLKITATKEFLGMKDKNEEKDEAIEVELVKEEMQDPYYDSGNPYGIPEEDLMKIKAKIEDLERKGLTGDTNHFDEARRLEGTIGKVRYASDKIGVEGLRESKYLTPDQKEAILERAFRYDLEGNKIAVLQVETGEKTSLGNISSPYRYIAEVITVVPELVRKHKSEILSLFERIEKLVLEGKLKKDSVKTLTADRKTIMDFLKLSEKKQEEPPAQAKAPKPVDRFEKMTVAEAKAIDPATLSYDDALEYRKRLLNLMFGSKADPQLKNDKVLDAKSEGVEILLTSKFSLAHIKQKYGSTEHYLLLAPYIEAIRPFSDPYYAKLGPYFGHRTKVDIISAVESLMSRAKYVEINKFRTVLERFMGTVGSAQRDPEKFLIDFSENYYKYNY